MSIAKSARIHSTAIISPEVEIADQVEVGAFALLEGNIKIGPECVIRPGAYIFGNVTLGPRNQVFSGAILGEKPQHLKYNNEPTGLEIGEGNIFREHVTIHRGTTASMTTRIGNHNFLMAGSHIGHDSVVGNRCILANGALVAGHCVLEDNVYLSGNSAVHQFIRVGRLAMLSGCTISTKDVPPFVIQQGVNTVCSINIVGMRRAGMKAEQINGIRQAFRILFREGFTLPLALKSMENTLGHLDAVQEMIAFIRKCPKGISTMRSRLHEEAA